MTDYEFGDIVLVPFPFSDLTATKRRPAAVISSSAYHRNRPDLIILAITSQSRLAPSVREISIAGWKESGLLKPSVFKPALTTIEKSLVFRKLGRLSEGDQRVLRELLRGILG